MRYVNVNGRLQKHTSAEVPYDSRAVRFGYGLFETMLVIDGEIQLKDYHWDRLFGGINKLKFVMPELMTKEWMEEEILRTVKKNNMEKLCRVRFQVYAGRGGLFDGQNRWTEFIIYSRKVEPHIIQLNEKGLSTIIAEGVAKSADFISNMKTTNAMLYSIAAQQAMVKKVDDAIILNCDGNPIETTIANLYCMKGDTVYTPPLSEGCVAGVMRRHVIQQLTENKYSVKEKKLTVDFLKSADAAFATNAIRRVKWIAGIDDKQYDINKILEVYENISY